MQAYENHPRLKEHIMRMELTGRFGTKIERNNFIAELNKALTRERKKNER